MNRGWEERDTFWSGSLCVQGMLPLDGCGALCLGMYAYICGCGKRKMDLGMVNACRKKPGGGGEGNLCLSVCPFTWKAICMRVYFYGR